MSELRSFEVYFTQELHCRVMVDAHDEDEAVELVESWDVDRVDFASAQRNAYDADHPMNVGCR